MGLPDHMKNYRYRPNDCPKTSCLAEHLATMRETFVDHLTRTREANLWLTFEHEAGVHYYLRPGDTMIESVHDDHKLVTQAPKVERKRKREVDEDAPASSQICVPSFAQKRDREVAFIHTFSQKRQRDGPRGCDIKKEKKKRRKSGQRTYQQKRSGSFTLSSSSHLSDAPSPKRFAVA